MLIRQLQQNIMVPSDPNLSEGAFSSTHHQEAPPAAFKSSLGQNLSSRLTFTSSDNIHLENIWQWSLELQQRNNVSCVYIIGNVGCKTLPWSSRVFVLVITGNSCRDIRDICTGRWMKLLQWLMWNFTSWYPRTPCEALTQRSACPLRADKKLTPSSPLEQVILVGGRIGLSPALISEYLLVRYFSTHSSSDLRELKGHMAAGNSTLDLQKSGGGASLSRQQVDVWTAWDVVELYLMPNNTRHISESFILVSHPPLMLPLVSLVVWNHRCFHLNVLLWGHKGTGVLSSYNFHKFQPTAKYPTFCGSCVSHNIPWVQHFCAVQTEQNER